jgi:hypothetical protein
MNEKHVRRHITLGRLSVYIVQGDVTDAAALAVLVQEREPWFTIPFGQHPTERLIAIDERYFVALGRLAMNDGMCMAVFDALERRRVSEIVSDKGIIWCSHLMVSACKKRLWLVQAHQSRSWSLPALVEHESLQTPFLHVEATALRSDGAIVAKGRDTNTKHDKDDRPAPPLTFVIAADGSGAEGYGASRLEPWKQYPDNFHSRFALSEGGRYLVGAHDGSLFLSDRQGNALTNLPTIDAINDSEVVPLLNEIHVSGVQEIWQAAPMKFERRVVVRTLSLFDCLSTKPHPEGFAADERWSSKQHEWLRLRDAGADTAVVKAAEVETGRLRDLYHHFAMARWWLRRALRFFELAPHRAWSLDDPPFFERGKAEDRINLHQYLLIPLKAVRGDVTDWEEADRSFTLKFPDGNQCQVTVEGDVGPLKLATPQRPVYRTVLAPEAVRTLGYAFIQRASIAAFKLNQFDEPSCLAAIGELAERLRRDPQSVVWGREMVIQFTDTRQTMSEDQFFDFVAANCRNAVGPLRKLLLAFDDANLPEEVWSTETVSASGFPALALARLDPEAYRYLRGYYSRRDPSHEPFGLEQIFPALSSFRTREARCFALDLLYEENMNGHGDNGLMARRILSDARSVCSPSDFVEELNTVRARLRSNIDASHDGDVDAALVAPLRLAAAASNSWDTLFVSLSAEMSK